jgi:hypothetical protein
MPTKRNLTLAAIVSLPLLVGACATSDRGRDSGASVGSSSQGARDGNDQAAREPMRFRTNDQQFDYPSY